jgi:hypothetical protein
LKRSNLHTVLGALLWVVFAYYWYLVVQRPLTPHTKIALIAVGSLVGGISVFSIYWIFHNIRIAKKRGRRRERRDAPDKPTQDFLGRTYVTQSDDELQNARYLEVQVFEVEGGETVMEYKTFRASDLLPEQM